MIIEQVMDKLTEEDDDPASQKKPKTVIDLWSRFIKRAIKFAKALPGTIFSFILAASTFVSSCVLLGVLMVVVAVAVYLVVNVHMRLPWPMHAAPYEDYNDKHVTQMQDLMRYLVDKSGTHGRFVMPALPGGGQCSLDVANRHYAHLPSQHRFPPHIVATAGRVLDLCACLLKRNLDEDLLTYFSYVDALRDMGWLSRIELRNAPQFAVEGDLDARLINEFNAGMVRPMQALRSALDQLSRAFHAAPQVRDEPWWTDDAFEYVAHVHELRLLLDYQPSISESFVSRKKGMPMAIWTAYYLPYVLDIYKKRIPEKWMRSHLDFVFWMTLLMNLWASLGEFISLIPCKLAYINAEDRAKNCKRNSL